MTEPGPTPERIAEIREWARHGAPGGRANLAIYDLLAALDASAAREAALDLEHDIIERCAEHPHAAHELICSVCSGAESWSCRAKTSVDPLQDCDWPSCGCDPHALQVIDALEEANAFEKIGGCIRPPDLWPHDGGMPPWLRDGEAAFHAANPGPKYHAVVSLGYVRLLWERAQERDALAAQVTALEQELDTAKGMLAAAWTRSDRVDAERDTLAATLARVRAYADKLVEIAAEASREWGRDNDSRVGKLLGAMAGRKGYRLDLDAVRDDALAAIDPPAKAHGATDPEPSEP